jgi:pimeloyl-ACP methyl ester carboxylesterase
MTRPHLMLLHGALGASTQFDSLKMVLKNSFEVHTLDFEGHGTSPLKDRPLRMAHYAENVMAYLDHKAVPGAGIFGHSLGGHVGLFLARFHPERITGVFTMGTKFNWTPEIAEKENKLLLPDKIMEKVPQFARQLKERHVAGDWEILLEKQREMQLHTARNNPLPDDDIRNISQKVRIGIGDRDKMVTLEESMRIYRLLEKGELQVFPNTPHPLEKAPVRKLAEAITDFFQNDRET